MTIAQLVECIVGKSCVTSGNIGDGTAFNKTDVNTIAQLDNYDTSDWIQKFYTMVKQVNN